MTKKEKRERLGKIIHRLKDVYPTSECALKYDGDPWKLLVMARLSAQCTDERVNEVSNYLFLKYPTPEAMAHADIDELCEIIRPCGLFRMKASNIKDASAMLISEYGGTLPSEMDKLLKIPGVGRKIANLLIGDIFLGEAVVCDTHCIRICARLGMYPENLKDPNKIEKILRELMDVREGSGFCHRIVNFGREFCLARGPRCHECPLSDLCEKLQKNK